MSHGIALSWVFLTFHYHTRTHSQNQTNFPAKILKNSIFEEILVIEPRKCILYGFKWRRVRICPQFAKLGGFSIFL